MLGLSLNASSQKFLQNPEIRMAYIIFRHSQWSSGNAKVVQPYEVTPPGTYRAMVKLTKGPSARGEVVFMLVSMPCAVCTGRIHDASSS